MKGWRNRVGALAALHALAACTSVTGARTEPSDPAGSTRSLSVVPRSAPAPVPSVAATSIYDGSFAVVVGIDDYVRLPRLGGAVNDARHVARVLADQGFDVTLVLNGEATRRRLVEVLADRLPERLSERDRVIVYFAGHGLTVGDEERPLGYLVPVDGDPSAPSATAIGMSELQQWFGVTYRAKHVLFVADACYSGLALQSRSAGASGDGSAYLRQITRSPVRFSLVAGSASQEASEWRGRGLFTLFFEQGIRGAADLNADGLVTSQELATYVGPEVAAFAATHLGREQLPQSARSGSGEFVFFVEDLRAEEPAPDDRPAVPALPLDEPEPSCALPGLSEALARVEAFEARGLSLPERATVVEIATRLRSEYGDLQRELGALEALLLPALGEPRCAAEVVDALDAMGRAAEHVAMALDTVPLPTLPEGGGAASSTSRREREAAYRAGIGEAVEPLATGARCDAAATYLRAIRRARESLAATAAARHALGRLHAFGEGLVARCVAGSTDADLAAPRTSELLTVRSSSALALDDFSIEPGVVDLGIADPTAARMLRRFHELIDAGQSERAHGLLVTAATSVTTGAGALAIASELRSRGLDDSVAMRRAGEAEDEVGLLVRALSVRSPGEARRLVRHALERIDERSSLRATAAMVRALVEERDRRHASAVRWYEAAARHGDARVRLEARRRIARLAAVLGASDRAVAIAADGLRESPDDPWLALFHALASVATDMTAARAEADRAAARAATEPRIQLGRGLVWLESALTAPTVAERDAYAAEAVVAFERARALAPVGSDLGYESALLSEEAAYVARPGSPARQIGRLPPEPDTRPGRVVVQRTAVEALVQRRLGLLGQCYSRSLAEDPNLRGDLRVRFVVARTGEVLFAEIVSSTVASTSLQSCVLDAMQRIVFPGSISDLLEVSYPLRFTPSE